MALVAKVTSFTVMLQVEQFLTMSAGLETFALKEEDAIKLLACQTHVGAANCDFQMEQYVWKRRADGIHIIHLRKTWEKLLLAARAIAAIDNPGDVCVVSARPYAQRALLKFAAHTGSTPIFGRFTPGCLTNQIQKQFKEPRLLIVSDPRVDHQAVTEASYVGVPVISFCNTDSPLKFIDIAIPCNNKGVQSIGLMWWLLAREVLLIKGKMTRQTGFVLDDKEIMPDLYFYRNPEEQEKEELAEPREVKEPWPGVPPPEVAKIDEVVRSIGMYQTIGGVEPAKKLDFSMVEPVSDWAQETERAVQLDAAQQQEWGASTQNSNWTARMKRAKIPVNDKSPFHTSPSPLHIKRILDAKRKDSESILRVKVNGAEICNIYRTFHGRLNVSYKRREDICVDAMDLLDQIAVYRGCEPSVIISYVAVVREVYLHACTNLKKEDVNTQERKRQMLEQWRQIEKHFAKIKYAMLDCWPVGNEPDLMAAYVSIALLYSLYKDVSDEKIIRQCHEAAERARKCGRVNLSESQFNEVQQYCDMIENIFFLRRQSAVSVSISKKRHVNSNVISDDDDHLAEYGKLTTAGKALTSENKCQKRLRPSDLEIKTAQKKLKYQKPINSTTILTEFEAVLLKRNATDNGDFEFPRPSDLKSANTRHYGPKCNLHLPDLYPANVENFNSLKANAKDLNLSNRIYQVLESSPIPNESPSSANQKISKMASAVSITSKDKTISESSQATDPNYSSCAQESQTNTVFQKLECYANEFVEKIIHSIIKMNEKPRICSRRNLEKIQVMDTPTVLTSNNCPISKQEFIVKLNNGSGTIDAKPDRMNKNILIRARKILRANIDQQIEDVFMESVAKTTPMGVITDPNSDDRLGKQIYEGRGMSNKTIVVEDHAEMQLSHNYIPRSLCNLQQTFESIASSDLSLITAPRAKLTTSVIVKPITIIGFSNLIDSSNKLTRDKKKLETESVADALEELKKKEISKLFAGKLKIETYMVPGHSMKFGNFWEELQELKGNKQQQLSTATKTIPMVTAAKIVLKQTVNQAGPDYVMQELDDTKRMFTVTQSKFLASKGNVFSGTDKNVSSVIWASNETISSATKINQKLQTAMTNHFDSSLDNTPMQKSNTDEICLTEIILDETRNFTKVSHTNRIKSQNEPLSKEILFEKYVNFEAPLCKLQRVPEFDAMPLFREHLQSNSRVPFQKFLIESMIPDQIRHQEYISDSKKEIQGVSKEVDNYEAILNFPVMVYSAFRKTKLRTVESIDVSIAQIKRIAKPDFQQPGQAFEIPSISSSSQITRINSENTTPSITNQEPVITEFEINEYIGSEQKIEKKCDGVKSELILKETAEKKKFSFTRNINQYHEKKEIQLDTFVVAPEIQQISLHRPQIAPPCPPPRQKLNKPTSIFSKPLLPLGYKHLVVAEKPSEAKKGFTKCDSKNTSFVASANSCQELLGVSEERASEDEKCQTLVYCEEKHSTIYDLENKLLTIRKESSEQLHENQETSAPLEVIQMPHFDAKAEFDKRLSVKKSRCGEVPVIVKNATLKSDSKLRLLKCLTNNSLIPPTLRLNVNEKPDFNFMIKNK